MYGKGFNINKSRLHKLTTCFYFIYSLLLSRIVLHSLLQPYHSIASKITISIAAFVIASLLACMGLKLSINKSLIAFTYQYKSRGFLNTVQLHKRVVNYTNLINPIFSSNTAAVMSKNKYLSNTQRFKTLASISTIIKFKSKNSV